MYLTYDEYANMGGTLTATEFCNVELDAEIIINWYTFDRLVDVTPVADRVKQCVFKLLDVIIARQRAFAQDAVANAPITSQTNDGVSVTYAVLSASEMLASSKAEMGEIVTRYLSTVRDASGRPVLYRGVYADDQ